MSQHPSFQKYFIAVGLDQPERDFFSEIKRRYHPHHRLSSPPHITLKPPFRMPNKSYLLEKLQKVANNERSFSVKLNMIGSFYQPKYGTVFLEPQKTKELKQLEQHLSAEIAFLPNSNNFYPHLTLAQRVDHDKINDVKSELRALNLKLKIKVDSIELFAFDEDTGSWSLTHSFSFPPHSRDV